jgi:serine/threonine protein kinase
MLSRNGPPKLADFGIAHVLDSTLTQEGALIGSPTYMSPEQFMGQRVDNRSDLFSLGVVLYELLTGERPFTGAAFSTVMHNVLKTDPVQPHELNFAIDEALSKVVMTAIAKAPQDRYRDGRAFAEALRNTVKAAPETAAPSISSDVTVRMHADGFFADATPGGGSSVQDRSVSADASNHLTGSDTRTTIVAARRHQGTRLSFSAVIALSVLLAGALSLLYLQRRPKSEVPFTPSAPSSVVLDTPQDPLDTAVQPGLKVSIYSTAYENEVYAYQDAFNRQGDTAAYLREAEAAGRIQLLRGAGYSVAVYDSANPSQPFSTESLTEDGYAQLELPDTAQRVTFKIYQGKTMLLSVELSAAACLNSQTFLIPPNRANPANAPVP